MKARTKKLRFVLAIVTGLAAMALGLFDLSCHDIQAALASGSDRPTLVSVTPDLKHVLVLRWRVGPPAPEIHEDLYWTLLPFRKVYVTK